MSINQSEANPLNVAAIPLSGVHLIEASAGTGKTFNITRIYLRLLLESKLSVTQILVMTYTNAATQELRGRITETLHQAKQYWQSADHRNTNPDPVFEAIYGQVCPEQSIVRLSLALVEMDEAAIYTLHGFCQRILKQMAFNTGNALQVTLQNDQQKALQRSVDDWFRLVREKPEQLTLLAQNNWHTPEAFISQFESLIHSLHVPELVDRETIEEDHRNQLAALRQDFSSGFNHHLQQVIDHQSPIFAGLIASQNKVEIQQQRSAEWAQLVNWLEQGIIEDIHADVGAFLNGNRYRRNEDIKAILQPIAEFRKVINAAVKKCQERTEKRRQELPLFELIAEGVAFVKRNIANQKQLHGEVSFDDLIQLLARAVDTDDDIAEQLVKSFPAALIDEFQDTDAQQYGILSKIYVDPPSAATMVTHPSPVLVMIGDPKQAIYGFRGGDIFTYLRARSIADHVWFMDTNWRSTQSMIAAYNRVFWGSALDQASRAVFGYGITYEQVKSTPHSAAAKRPIQGFNSPQHREALTYVVADDEAIGEVEANQHKPLQQAQLSQWCVTEIKRLLMSVKLGEDKVKPADIAILVRSGIEAERISEYLRYEGLTAVYLSDKTPIFSSAQAHELLLLLTGVWHCDNDSDLIRALSSPLLGVAPMRLAKMQEDPEANDWSDLRKQVFNYRYIWLQQGIMPLLFTLLKAHYQPKSDGERALTNYLHLTELLEQASHQHTHPLQILQWLQAKIEHNDLDEQHEQRLESDAGLIKIVTQHKSKGLEYPFVFVPYANEYRDPTQQNRSTRRIFRYFDPESDSQVWQLGESQRAIELLREQEHAESIRLLYVAITRAEYHCYLGIGEYPDSQLSSIGLALGKHHDGSDTLTWRDFLMALSQVEENHCTVEVATQLPSIPSVPSVDVKPPLLTVKSSTRSFEQKWRVHSFSGLTRFNDHANWTERDNETSVTVSPNTESAPHDMRFRFPKGATPGNFIHDVFEYTDFTAPDWRMHCEAMNTKYALLADEQLPKVCDWFDSVINAPIVLCGTGSIVASLSQMPISKTLREAEFYFPIASLNSQNLTDILSQHRYSLCEQGLLSPELAQKPLQLSRTHLEGMMHGFIDLIFEHQGKFYVADYKSTYLGGCLEDYLPPALAENNQMHAYDMQYLIYALALHRYLQQQLPDYDPDVHFGGVCYLYVRGMQMEDGAQLSPTGVFYTPIATELLESLDQTFSGRQQSVSL